jgi:hypothetical protein
MNLEESPKLFNPKVHDIKCFIIIYKAKTFLFTQNICFKMSKSFALIEKVFIEYSIE